MIVHDIHKSEDGEELLSTKEAAELLPQTSAATLARWAREGKVPVVRLPSGRMFFRREDIEALLVPTTESAEEPVSEEDAEIASQETSEEFGEPLPGLEEFDR